MNDKYRWAAGRKIVLIHGAAATSRIWRLVIAELHVSLPYTRILVPDRRCTGNMDKETDDLWEACSGALVVGVSGGATLAWALASRKCPMLGMIAHEPAAGNLCPGLLSYAGSAWSESTLNPVRRATLFGERLYGTQWNADELPSDVAAVSRDYRMFSQFNPAPPRINPSVITLTIGALSPKIRYDAAQAYEQTFGIPSHTLAGAKHCVQLEQPRLFADVIASHLLAATSKQSLA
ncbi:hypothetical protein BISU_1234 [Bifidobacterium subtile]|uniref:AB hydrolase-1 domain-containing protein n=2 Tax=Bifidobacterium subtile TaxID=77635 RepID=A0A087E8U5_9BIFI|nr:hypothetical protein BISU_1234 [Bifidobacterium subtile]QOL36782.1 alpha/beta hydrolase [Bifidobacterium subtile]